MSANDLEKMAAPRTRLSRRRLLHAAGLGAGALAFPNLLAACSSGGGSSDQPKGIEDVPQVQLGAETPGVLYPEGYVGPRASEKKPFADGSRKFTVVVPSDVQVTGDWNKSKATAWFKQRTGLDVEFQAVLITAADGSQDLTKINAILASGDLPDAFMGIPFTNDQISLYGSQGVFVALDDYLQTYAPEWRRMQSEYPSYKKLVTALDGKMYQYTGINDCYHCRIGTQRTWVNTEYLEAVGAEMPTTTDELRETLMLLKSKDPSPGKNIIPFAGQATENMDVFFMNAFTYNPGGTTTGGWMRIAGGKVEFVANTDEWREALKYMNTLFNDGTLPRTSFTTPSEAFLRGGNQGRYGMARSWYWGGFADIKYTDDALWKKYTTMGPLKGPNGTAVAAWNHFNFVAPPGVVVTSKCPNPELMVQWADYQMELEAVMVGYGGTKDDNWTWAEKGGTAINGKQPIYQLQVWPAPVGQSWNQYSVMYRSNDFRLGQYIDPKAPNFEKDLYEASRGYEPAAIPEDQQLPPLIFDESAAAQRSDTAVSVSNHITQSMARFTVGELDVNDDSVWQTYLKKFEDMGLPDYVKLHQDAFDKRPQ